MTDVPDAPPAEVTQDSFLGGRLSIAQPARGNHRAGLDAVFLAAAVTAKPGETVLDLGAGVGTAGLAAAIRLDGIRVVMVERDAALARLAERNAAANGLADRVAILRLDVGAPGRQREAAGLMPEMADHAIVNPPFHRAGTVRRPATPGKDRAHVLQIDLSRWIRTAVSALKPGGSLHVIHRPEHLGDVLDAFRGRLGGAVVFPLFPRQGRAAVRVLLAGRKGSRAPMTLGAGLVLHEEGSPAYTAAAEAILRGGAALDLAGS